MEKRYPGDLVGIPTNIEPINTKALILPRTRIGVEIEFERWNRVPPKPAGMWVHHPDEHSVRNNGTEFVTVGKGLQGQRVIDALDGFCESARENNWDEGHPRAAIHVHMDVSDLDLNSGDLRRLMGIYFLVEHVFFHYAGEWRRHCGFCVAYEDGINEDDIVAELVTGTKASEPENLLYLSNHCSRYQAVNLNAISKFGTLEFRHLPTTFDKERIVKWINMVMAVKRAALEMPELKDPLGALSTLGPHALAEKIFSGVLSKEFIFEAVSPQAMWQACDMSQALMGVAGQLKIEVPNPSVAWEALSLDNVNPILEKKRAALASSQSRKRKVA